MFPNKDILRRHQSLIAGIIVATLMMVSTGSYSLLYTPSPTPTTFSLPVSTEPSSTKPYQASPKNTAPNRAVSPPYQVEPHQIQALETPIPQNLVKTIKTSSLSPFSSSRLEKGAYEHRILPLCTPQPSCDSETPDSELSVLFYDIENKELLASVNSKKQMPVASAFKVGVLLYALDHLDKDIWQKVPVQYWSQEGDIPEDTITHLREYWILSRLYDMIVNSSNEATAQVLAYINRTSKTTSNPIEQFNEWSHHTVGTSRNSGLFAWEETPLQNYYDYSLSQRLVKGRCNTERYFFNTYSAQDLALYYLWLTEKASLDVKLTTLKLLNILEGPSGLIKNTANSVGGEAYNKSGQYGKRGVNYVWVDAGIITTDTGGAYLIVTSSWNTQDLLPDIYEEFKHIIRTAQ